MIFTDNEKKFLDISDKCIIKLMNEKEGIPDRIVEPLEMAVMYGEDSNGPWVLLSFDLCESGYKFIDTIREPIMTELGIPSERIIILCSHVHVFIGLTFIGEAFRGIILNTVKSARSSSEEAEMAKLNLEIDAEHFTMNRRINIDGIGTRTVMFNDDCEIKENYIDATGQVRKWIEDFGFNPDDYLQKGTAIKSNGPIDKNLDGLFFRSKETDILIGSFVRFACHPVIVSQVKVKGEISPDYPGCFKKRIERKLGGVAIFGNGACGDIKPLNLEYSHNFARCFGEKLADKLIDAFPSVKWEPLEKAHFWSEPVVLPLRSDFPVSVTDAKNKMKDLEKCYDNTSKPSERRELQNLYRIHSFVAGGLLEDLRPKWLNKRQAEFSINAIRLNDTAIMTSNGEIFTKTGKAMVEPFKDRHPLLATVSNETLYYVLPADEFENGGYEYGGCMLAPGADEKLITLSNKLLKRVFSESK